MPRISKKENKNIYQKLREKHGISREGASKLLEAMTPPSV